MALINCPECKHQISDAANSCPHCGYVISQKKEHSGISKIINHLMERPLIFVLCIMAIICLIVALKWEKSDTGRNNKNNYNMNYNTYYSSDVRDDSSTIFSNLSMSNFSSNLGQYGGKMSCEVLNNNSFTVHGYFYVGFYDKGGTLLYSQLMSLPSVASGEKVICSTLIPKDDYPTGYSYVRYSQATLVKD